MSELYYDKKMLSVSSVRLFVQNPKRALDHWNEVEDWFADRKPLIYGSYVHAGLEDFIKDSDKALTEIRENEPSLYKKVAKTGANAGKLLLYSEYEQAGHVLDVLKSSDIVQWIYAKAHDKTGRYATYVEQPFEGKLNGIGFKGKPDVFVVDKDKKIIYMFDYKTSSYYDPSGNDWGTDVSGTRTYGNVAWHAEKLFPWQAGAYRELMRQNGFEDYKIDYRYIVATKEKEPRIDIWAIDDQAMDEGLSAFSSGLIVSNGYVSGTIEAPLVADHSPWFNKQTQKQGNLLSVGSAVISDK